AANSRHATRSGGPVRQITVLRHLIGAKDRDIQMPAPHHGETVGMVEKRRPGIKGDGLFASIDQVPILLSGGRGLAKAKDAVFGMEHRLTAGGWNLATISGKPMPRFT